MFLIKRLIPGWMKRRERLLITIGATCAGSRRLLAQNEGFTDSTPVDLQRTAANLKLISWALYNYHDADGCFPPQAIIGKDGQPLLSWRVAVLPFLAQPDYYLRFRRDEPWDSKHNVQSFLAQQIDKEGALPGLGGPDEQGFHALTRDGSVHFLRKDIDTNLLRSAITRNDGEVGVRRGLLEHTV